MNEDTTDDSEVPYRSETISINGSHNMGTFCNKCFKAIFFDSSDFEKNPQYKELWQRQLCTTCYKVLNID